MRRDAGATKTRREVVMRKHNWVHASHSNHMTWCTACDAFYGTVSDECPGAPPAPPTRRYNEQTRPITTPLHQPPKNIDAVHPVRDANGKRVK